jgi:DNA-binding transcriptional regulator YiaG
MEMQTFTEAGVDLLDRLRSRRQLPLPSERRRIREEAGCSLREFGAALGVSWMAISRWEAGALPRNPSHIRAYGRLLDEMKQLQW